MQALLEENRAFVAGKGTAAATFTQETPLGDPLNGDLAIHHFVRRNSIAHPLFVALPNHRPYLPQGMVAIPLLGACGIVSAGILWPRMIQHIWAASVAR